MGPRCGIFLRIYMLMQSSIRTQNVGRAKKSYDQQRLSHIMLYGARISIVLHDKLPGQSSPDDDGIGE